MEKNADSDAQFASHNTSIRNLEVQMGQISQALNFLPKGALPSDTVVNPNSGSNMGHAMDVSTRSGRGGNAPTSNKRQLVDDDRVMQEYNNMVQPNDEVWIDIYDSVEDTQEEVNPSREHFIDILEPLEDPGAFTIPGTIRSAEFAKALCDLGESINLMPYSIFKTLGIGQPRPTSMILQMAEHTMKRPLGVIEDILVRVDKFILPADFVILDCEADYEVSIILGRPFLATGTALCDIEARELTFRVGDEKVVFHVCKSMWQPNSNATINVGDMLEAVLVNFGDDEMDGFMECVNSFQGMRSYNYAPRKLSLDLENRTTPPIKPSIEEPPTLELNPLPPHL
ncbi:uncharacterized protein [Nicotiana tomentosiformis]|uniref:uncharacterized protein n=1 Tax=Nicotiana tomentosiformis TaxID=4098 RepID=UPI00388C9885